MPGITNNPELQTPARRSCRARASRSSPAGDHRDRGERHVSRVAGRSGPAPTRSSTASSRRLPASSRTPRTRNRAAVGRSRSVREDIPLATDELDAVVGATEEGDRYHSRWPARRSRRVQRHGAARDRRGAITGAVTRIYEACNFQDITGQRITKVVKTLKHIEDRVSAMLSVFGDETCHRAADRHAAPVAPPPASKPPAAASEGDLLNGPQLPDDAKKQAEIDAISPASIDNPPTAAPRRRRCPRAGRRAVRCWSLFAGSASGEPARAQSTVAIRSKPA